jgi:hypothetical protein
MAKRKTADVEFVDDLPLKPKHIPWKDRLEPVYRNPGYWARINTADTPEKAMSQQGNLTSRKVSIPDPEGDWDFASRGCEVFAKYNGTYKRKAPSGRVRRTQRKR